MTAAANRKLVLGIVILVSFLYFVFVVVSSTSPDPALACDTDCPHEKQVELLTNLVPLFVSLGVMAGAGVYFLMAGRVESREKSLKGTTEVLLKFLSREEKAVVNKLIEENGKVLQAELSRLPGVGKVKAHRVIQRLVDRGVIETEGYGKTNIVRFTKEIREALL